MRFRVLFGLCVAEVFVCGFSSAIQAVPPAAIIPLPTVETAMVGRFSRGPLQVPVAVGPEEFVAMFGSAHTADWPAEVQARQFFANGGAQLHVVRVDASGPLETVLTGNVEAMTGVNALALVRDLRLVLIPELSRLGGDAFATAFARCREFIEPRRLFLLIDPPPALPSSAAAAAWVDANVPADAGFCAVYYPYLQVMLDGVPMTNAPSGALAALYARNDALFAIWHSPAGTGLPLVADGLWPASPNTAEQDQLNTHGVCAVRQFTGTGIVPWGARTLDRVNGENRYVSVVRTRLWIAASIERALAFTASADNGEPLWNQLRGLVGNFLQVLFQAGALVGSTPQQAYFVRCDASTTSAADIAAHRVRLLYGTAMLRPAEFDFTETILMTHDPERPAPVVPLLLRQLPDELLLASPTVAGFSYALEFSDSLEPGTFAPTGLSMAGDGSWWAVPGKVASGQGYYRMAIIPVR
jgi:hypothetical protein